MKRILLIFPLFFLISCGKQDTPVEDNNCLNGGGATPDFIFREGIVSGQLNNEKDLYRSLTYNSDERYGYNNNMGIWNAINITDAITIKKDSSTLSCVIFFEIIGSGDMKLSPKSKAPKDIGNGVDKSYQLERKIFKGDYSYTQTKTDKGEYHFRDIDFTNATFAIIGRRNLYYQEIAIALESEKCYIEMSRLGRECHISWGPLGNHVKYEMVWWYFAPEPSFFDKNIDSLRNKISNIF